mmetsp:Transcript_98183/g.316681  ORF Transcript_98183/g.316681 Transcript_98183/m.316681 type:complete len:204 (+) Transcript_98183:1072-1683(+)
MTLRRRSTRSTCSTRSDSLCTPAGPRIHIGKTPVSMMSATSRVFIRSQSHTQPKARSRTHTSSTKTAVKKCSNDSSRSSAASSVRANDVWTPMSSPLMIIRPPTTISNNPDCTQRMTKGSGCLNCALLRRALSAATVSSSARIPVAFLNLRTSPNLLSTTSVCSSICSVVMKSAAAMLASITESTDSRLPCILCRALSLAASL